MSKIPTSSSYKPPAFGQKMSDADDKELARYLKLGDEVAWLFMGSKVMRSRVWGFINKKHYYIREWSDDDKKDLWCDIRENLISAVRSYKEEPHVKFFTWLCKVVNNCCSDAITKHINYAKVSSPPEDGYDPDWFAYTARCDETNEEEIAEKAYFTTRKVKENGIMMRRAVFPLRIHSRDFIAPDQAYDNKQLSALVNAYIEKNFSSQNREIFACYVAGYSADEIKEELRLNINKRAISYRLKAMKDELEAYGERRNNIVKKFGPTTVKLWMSNQLTDDEKLVVNRLMQGDTSFKGKEAVLFSAKAKLLSESGRSDAEWDKLYG